MGGLAVDDRNYETTNALAETLNARKGFEVAMGNPRKGRLIIRHNGTSFFLEITPIYKKGCDDDYISTTVAKNEYYLD